MGKENFTTYSTIYIVSKSASLNHDTKMDYENLPKAEIVEVVPMNTSTSMNLPKLSNNNISMDEQRIKQLMDKRYTRGLSNYINKTKKQFALRIWIIDNSGSMNSNDGSNIVDTYNGNERIRMVPCTRWEEIRDCVKYHIEFAEIVQAPTSFRFLNAPDRQPQRFGVAGAIGSDQVSCNGHEAITIMNNVQASGCTPLTSHIMEIQREVKVMASQLRKKRQRLSITIATDGLPTDERGYGGNTQNQLFIQSLSGLEGLPVWVVIRLCTDDDDVVSFYKELDSQLELSIEVLDDFVAEAKKVRAEIPWLNYALPLHRLREMGYQNLIFNMLDEMKLDKCDLRDFCSLLFGKEIFDNPFPSLDWEGFVNCIDLLQRKEELQWNPIRKKFKPWISLNKLNHAYGHPKVSPMLLKFFNYSYLYHTHHVERSIYKSIDYQYFR